MARWTRDCQRRAARPWWEAIDCLDRMTPSERRTAADALAVGERSLWRRRHWVRFPRHGSGRAMVALADSWLTAPLGAWSWSPPAPGSFRSTLFRQPWGELLAWLEDSGFSVKETAHALGYRSRGILWRRGRCEWTYARGERMLLLYWRARAGLWVPRRGLRARPAPPEGVLPPVLGVPVAPGGGVDRPISDTP